MIGSGNWSAMRPQFPPPSLVPIIGGCQWIDGDPMVELAAGRDPHCNKPRGAVQSAYCTAHDNLAYYRPKRGAAADGA